MWDVFISHAWEDKDTIARPLATALLKAGLKVWYDEFTLKLGDSLRRSINLGLSQSRYGVVILSPYFFDKEWPQRELDGLVAREVSSGKIILPVWHNVTREDVEHFSPVLADRLGVSTANGLDSVVQEILCVVKPRVIPISGSVKKRKYISEELLEPQNDFLQKIEMGDTTEKILFYIYYMFDKYETNYDIIKEYYLEAVRGFGLNSYEHDFDRLLEKHDFIVEPFKRQELRIKFLHPEFLEAVGESFCKNKNITGGILLVVAEKRDMIYRWCVPHIICEHFEKLSEESRELLFMFAKDEESGLRYDVARAIDDHFEKIPEKYRRLLFVLARDRNAFVRTGVAMAIGRNFDKSPLKYRKLLQKFRSDTSVLDRIREHKEEGVPEWLIEAMKILERELDL